MKTEKELEELAKKISECEDWKEAAIKERMKKERKFTGFSNLKVPKLLKQESTQPIFYHSASCQCEKCHAKKRNE